MSKKKILLVEDEYELAEMIKLRLEANNYEAVIAYDGQEALDLVSSQRPDLILLDLVIPKIDGLQVCKIIKAEEKLKNTPVIIFTARAKEEEKQYVLKECGASAYITKPFESQELLDKIKENLERSSS